MNELLTMLDTKYKRLEYIQSTGTQWIDTGITRNSLNKWRFKGSINFQDVTTRQIMGVGSVVYFGCVNGYWQIGQTGTGNTGKTIQINTDNVFDIEINSTNNTYNATINGENISGLTGPNGTQNYNLLLFNAGVTTGFYCSCKLKYLQIYKDDTLVRNFVPVLRKSDNEIGMLDLVEGKFYGNAGTGKFTANLDTMYALIQGTPTVQDGRVWGFSSSNYLKTNVLFDNTKAIQNCEIQCKFKFDLTTFASTSTQQQVLGAYFRGEADGIRVSGSGRVIWSILGSQLYLQTNANYLQTNLNYIARGTINNGLAKLYVGTSENNLEEVASVSIPTEYTLGMQRKITIGVATNTADPFQSSIDLNRSYIKIDDTKYRLQAVVGYTKVGSPTITDGVVSGFSGSDYIKIEKAFNFDNWEFCSKIKGNGSIFVQDNGGLRKLKLSISNLGEISFRPYSNSSGRMFLQIANFNNTTFYYIKLKRINNIAYLSYSTDNTNYTTAYYEFEQWNTSLENIIYGYCSNDPSYFSGSIDLNNTYIKINHQLWFNGLEA